MRTRPPRYLDAPLGAISMTTSSASFYYHHDPLDSITDVTDASGTAQWAYSYDPDTTSVTDGYDDDGRLHTVTSGTSRYPIPAATGFTPEFAKSLGADPYDVPVAWGTRSPQVSPRVTGPLRLVHVV